MRFFHVQPNFRSNPDPRRDYGANRMSGPRLSTQAFVIPGRAPARTRNLEVMELHSYPVRRYAWDDQRGPAIGLRDGWITFKLGHEYVRDKGDERRCYPIRHAGIVSRKRISQ